MTYYVIYWEKDNNRGFVSYNNSYSVPSSEYEPFPFSYASRYKNKKDAEKTRDWYVKRGGFGTFIILKVE